MSVTIRFFARFRELLGTDIAVENGDGMILADLIRTLASKNREGYDAIFDENGKFREYVILMRNGRREDSAKAAVVRVSDGDEIAIFPPVAGG